MWQEEGWSPWNHGQPTPTEGAQQFAEEESGGGKGSKRHPEPSIRKGKAVWRGGKWAAKSQREGIVASHEASSQDKQNQKTQKTQTVICSPRIWTVLDS